HLLQALNEPALGHGAILGLPRPRTPAPRSARQQPRASRRPARGRRDLLGRRMATGPRPRPPRAPLALRGARRLGHEGVALVALEEKELREGMTQEFTATVWQEDEWFVAQCREV